MPTASSYPRVQIPNVDVGRFILDQLADINPDRVILSSEDGPETYTASSLVKASKCFSEFLSRQEGWKHGAVLTLVCENSIHTPLVVLGALAAGHIVSPANPAYSADELRRQMRDSGSSIVVTQRPLLATVLSVAESLGLPQERIVLLPDTQAPVSSSIRECRAVELADILSNPNPRGVDGGIDAQNDVAFLVYTSGTTGMPKGAQLTHQNVVANILMSRTVTSVRGNSIVLALLPFFHIYGLTIVMLLTLYQRACLLVMKRFDLKRFCSAIESRKISLAYIVPPIAAVLCDSAIPDNYDLSSVECMVSGAAPLSVSLIDRLHTHRGIKLIQGYGLTETSPAAFMMSLEDFGIANGTVGRLLPNQEVKLVDVDDSSLKIASPTQDGEICIRGPNIFRGYLHNTAATRAAFTSDGFFRTGDVGRLEEGGYLRITDRIKDLIKYKGFQVAPAELESILLGHPAVADVCVVGIVDRSQTTEVPRAYVVRSARWNSDGAGTTTDEEAAREIRAWADGRVAHHKKLRGGVHFVQQLPRTASGKILRRQIRVVEEKSKL